MSFIKVSGNTVSFAEFQDLIDRDQRILDANEGLNDENVIEPLLIRATERILTRIRSTSWYIDHFDGTTIPSPNANYVLERQNDFTDLCVYVGLAEYILPMIADFGTEDNAEYRKMGYYKQKGDELFAELIKSGDFYDFDNSGTVSASEKTPGVVNLRRVR